MGFRYSHLEQQIITRHKPFHLLDGLVITLHVTIEVGCLGVRIQAPIIDIILALLGLVVATLLEGLEVIKVFLVAQELNEPTSYSTTKVRYGRTHFLPHHIQVGVVVLPNFREEHFVGHMLRLMLSGLMVAKSGCMGFDGVQWGYQQVHIIVELTLATHWIQPLNTIIVGV